MKPKQSWWVLLLLLPVIFGVIIMFVGIKDTYNFTISTRNYQETDGYFTDYHLYSADEDGQTYTLTYSYVVNGHEYTVSTKSGTQILPKTGSVRKIKYDPISPDKAVIVGASNDYLLIMLGVMFTFIPMVFVLTVVHSMGYLQKSYKNIMDFGVGILFMVIGLFTIFVISGGFSIQKMLVSYKIPGVIASLLVVTGGAQLIKSIYIRIRKINK